MVMSRSTDYGRWIPGYENVYSISRDKIVYSHKTLKPSPLKVRGGSVDLTLELGENKRKSISVAYAEAYPEDFRLSRNEKWINGYEGHYALNDKGEVFSFKKGKTLLKHTGFIKICKNGYTEQYSVKDLVESMF